MKRCSKCKQLKDESEFYKHTKKPDGLDCWCKVCHKKISQDYVIRNKEKELIRKKKWWEENKYRYLKRPAGKKKKKVRPSNCKLCGYEGIAIDEHHIHGRKKSRETIYICANCHREIHAGMRELT